MNKLFNLIKKVMNTEESEVKTTEESTDVTSTEEVLPTEENTTEESPDVKEPEPVVVFEKCGCPENANKAQWQLDTRCMFCGKEFYSTI